MNLIGEVRELNDKSIEVDSFIDIESNFKQIKSIYMIKRDSYKEGIANLVLSEGCRRVGNYNGSKEYLNNALFIFKNMKNNNGLSWYHLDAANTYRANGEYKKSFDELVVSRSYCVKSKNFLVYGHVLSGIAENNRIIGNYFISMKQHLAALHFFKNFNDIKGIIWALEGIGQIYRIFGRYKRALYYFKSALELSRISHDVKGMAYAFKCIGEIQSVLGEGHLSVLNFANANQAFTSIGYKIGVGFTLKAISDHYLRTFDFSNSYEYCISSIKIFEKYNYLRGYYFSILSLSNIYLLSNNINRALELAYMAYEFFYQNNIRLGRSIALRIIRRVSYA